MTRSFLNNPAFSISLSSSPIRATNFSFIGRRFRGAKVGKTAAKTVSRRQLSPLKCLFSNGTAAGVPSNPERSVYGAFLNRGEAAITQRNNSKAGFFALFFFYFNRCAVAKYLGDAVHDLIGIVTHSDNGIGAALFP